MAATSNGQCCTMLECLLFISRALWQHLVHRPGHFLIWQIGTNSPGGTTWHDSIHNEGQTRNTSESIQGSTALCITEKSLFPQDTTPVMTKIYSTLGRKFNKKDLEDAMKMGQELVKKRKDADCCVVPVVRICIKDFCDK